MKGTTHVRYELLRALRSWRTLFLSFGLPLVVFCVIVPSKRHAVSDGIPFPLYFMTGMAAYGAMWGSINPGARIARDRAKGWVVRCGSRRCGPVPKSGPRSSRPTSSRCSPWPCCTWPALCLGYASMRPSGSK